MYIYNLPDELMDDVIAFAARQYTPATKGKPDTITVNLTNCRKFTMLDVKYNSKFWWSNGSGGVITPVYMDKFLNMSKYVLFEIIAATKNNAVTHTAVVQLIDIVGDTVDSYCHRTQNHGVLLDETACKRLKASLVKEFKMIVQTIDTEDREAFKVFITTVFFQMFSRMRKYDLTTDLKESFDF